MLCHLGFNGCILNFIRLKRLPLVINYKACYKEHKSLFVTMKRCHEHFTQRIHFTELSFPMLPFSKFSQNQAISITDYGSLKSYVIFLWWRLKPTLWAIEFYFCQSSVSKCFQFHVCRMRSQLADCPSQFIGKTYFFLYSDASQSSVYKQCQKQGVLGIFHLKEK